MKQIEKFGVSKLLVASSLEFHDSAESRIRIYPSIVTTLGATFTNYAASINDQRTAANKDTRLVNTEQIHEVDSVRDPLVRRLFRNVDDFSRSPITDEKTNGKIIKNKIERFRGLADYEMSKETTEIKNMIIVLREQEVMTAVTALELEGLILKIEDANNAFIDAMTKRIDGESGKVKLNTAEMRKITEACYAEVILKINAFAIATPSEDLDKCIDSMNALVEQYERIVSRMRSGGSGNEKLPKKDNET